MQKVVGWVLAVGSGLIILYNVVQSHEDQRQIEEHPFITILSGGENLKGAYTFLPPYTGFEIVVIAVLVIGAIMIYTAKQTTE